MSVGSSGSVSSAEERVRLLERAREGDGQAFGQLVGHHRSMLWAVCLRITNNPQDAEDALQDCLIAAWHNLAKFRGDSAVSTWLYRIAANAALAVARKTQRVDPVEEIIVTAPDQVSRLEADLIVHRALAELSETHRETLVLRELCDFTYEQVAAHQGVPVQTVKSRLNRARAALKEVLVASGYAG